MNSRVILLTGQYGTSHDIVGNTLCNLANERLRDLSRIQPISKFYSIDKEIWKITGGSQVFFDFPTDNERHEAWKRAFSTIKAKIEHENPVFAIISLHVINYWKGRFFSCVDWDYLITIKPRVIITIIDDIYDIHTRIIETQRSRGVTIPEGQYNLLEILSWRLREIHTCNLFSKHLFINPGLFPSIKMFL